MQSYLKVASSRLHTSFLGASESSSDLDAGTRNSGDGYHNGRGSQTLMRGETDCEANTRQALHLRSSTYAYEWVVGAGIPAGGSLPHAVYSSWGKPGSGEQHLGRLRARARTETRVSADGGRDCRLEEFAISQSGVVRIGAAYHGSQERGERRTGMRGT